MVSRLSTRDLSSILACAWGLVRGPIATSSLQTASHNKWSMLLCVISTAVYKDGSFVGRLNVAPDFLSLKQRQCAANGMNRAFAYQIGGGSNYTTSYGHKFWFEDKCMITVVYTVVRYVWASSHENLSQSGEKIS